MMKEFWNWFKNVGDNLLHWRWTQSLLYWIIFSAGTMSELAFLLASMWMGENSAAHEFVLQFLTEDMTKHLSYWATGAYVGLPVAILPLAILTVITHATMWHYLKKRVCGPALWCILYGLPTLVFLSLDVITIACSVLSVNFELPGYLIVARALSAWMFAIIALIYVKTGKNQEVDRHKEKDQIIADLQEQIGTLIGRIETINDNTRQRESVLSDEIASLKTQLLESHNQQKVLQTAAIKGTEEALEAYGQDCVLWVRSEPRSAPIDEISHYTGHSKQKIRAAKLTSSPRNPSLILKASVEEWLKNAPPSERRLHLVNE